MKEMNEGALRGLISDGCTDEERQLTLQYFESLKGSQEGWKLCVTEFTQKPHSNERVKFFCLQVLEHFVRNKYATSSVDDILSLRKVVMSWLQTPRQGEDAEKTFIKNKMAQIFALMFIIDYPLKWPTFFSDVLQCVQSGTHWSVDLYLRILLAIDGEVVDRHIIHTAQENTRNTVIKDTMRDNCVPQLVDSWLQVMTTFEQVDHAVVCQAMAVVGAFVSWIDINLIANDSFVSLLLKYLAVSSLRESAAECLTEIVGKGMDPVAKTKLVESFCKVLESVGVLSSSSSTEVKEVEFQIKLSQLVNGMGCALVTSLNRLVKSGDEVNAKVTLAALETKLPYLHRYLSDVDDGVSEAIIEFAVQYVGLLKHHSTLSDDNRANLQALLEAVVNKLKYDEDYNFANEGEEEVMFLEYRKQLKVLFDNIALLDPQLVLLTTHGLLTSVLGAVQSEPFMNVEVVLRVFFMLGEIIIDKQLGAANIAVAGTLWHQMMNVVIQSDVGHYNHIAVLLQYYEILVRYEKFFSLEINYIAPVMESFLGVQGLRHPSVAVRSRLSYLFVRFVKATKTHLGMIAERILKNLQELLLMFPGSPEYSSFFSSNDLMFLYEAAGVLVVSSQQPPEGKKLLLNSVLSPVVEKFPIFLAQLSCTQDIVLQEQFAQASYNLVSFASRTSKVFTNHQQAQKSGCLECFSEPLPVFLHGLEVSVQREVLHSGVRQYLHRMIICLGDELLKYVPMAVSLLLKDSKSHDIQEFIPLINQLISKYKERITPILMEIFMPVCQNIMMCLSLPFDQNDLEEQRDRQNLQKSYFVFINSIATNNVAGVIANQESDKLQEVLESVVQGALSFPDPSVQKVCFSILKKLIDSWGGQEVVPGFVTFTYKQIIPTCFVAPLKPTFDLNDGHSFLALGEVAGILKSVIAMRGTEVLVYLQSDFLPSLNMPIELIQELLQQLQQSEVKVLKTYLKALFTQLRTTSTSLEIKIN